MQILKWLSSSWFLLLMWNFGAGSRAGSIVCNRSAKVVSILFLKFFSGIFTLLDSPTKTLRGTRIECALRARLVSERCRRLVLRARARGLKACILKFASVCGEFVREKFTRTTYLRGSLTAGRHSRG